MSADDQADVIIVGAGLAGLAAARVLHRAGVTTIVCEASDDVGGRVRTDVIDGFRLDRGFQVLLPAYPEVRKVLNGQSLSLRPFTRGALTADGTLLAAPTRGFDAVKGVAGLGMRSPVSSAGIAALSLRDLVAPARRLRQDSGRTIDGELARWRVSDEVKESVLRPFLAGVFLDPGLETSARLFHFIWRCFLLGGGAVPATGMQALSRNLAAQIPVDVIRTGAEVEEVTAGGVRLKDGRRLRGRAVVVATDGTTASRLLPGVTEPPWHSVTTFYYALPEPPLRAPTLVLDGEDELLINTAVMSEVSPGYAPPGRALVAASTPGRCDASGARETRVRERLAALYATSTRDWDLITAYPIPHALPVMPAGHPLTRPVRLAPGLYVCGDHRDTSSIQGALVSGRRAAQAVLQELKPA